MAKRKLPPKAISLEQFEQEEKMASKKKGGIKVVHKEQREQIPTNIAYRTLSVNDGGGTRIIGYAENYADAENMATRHIRNVSKVQARIDECNVMNNEWIPIIIVAPASIDSGNKPQFFPIAPKE